ncbi:protein mono-ADP-ribosyltransferase PARP12-like [Spea bombifrons]|uniref:protein mono-ADP-ribosyltransferase PARP12-like n=1 Tax=Spea bombifrons TaxID=233779 RepID=UPI00234AF5A9|nr:protein mono-ADP-ribosyltransferase PARP12-like [Spea bombifrons]
MSDPVVTAFLTKLICERGGALPRAELGQLLDLPQEQIDEILQAEEKRFPQCGDLVLARSPLRLCADYLNGKEEEDADCDKLHLCSYYLQGKSWLCKKKQCKSSHNTKSDHNLAVLKANDISGLNDQELKILFMQNDPFILPGICRKYVHSACDQDGCPFLHICGFFVRGTCNRQVCKKRHDLLESGSDELRKRYSEASIKNFQMILDIQHRERAEDPANNGRTRGAGRTRGRGTSRGTSRGSRSRSRVSGQDSDDEVPGSVAKLSLSQDNLDQEKGSGPFYSTSSSLLRAIMIAGNMSGGPQGKSYESVARNFYEYSGISRNVTASYTSGLQKNVSTSSTAQPTSTVRANTPSHVQAEGSSSAQPTTAGNAGISKNIPTASPSSAKLTTPVGVNVPKNVSTASSPSAEKTTAAASMSKNGSTASPPVYQPATPLQGYIFRNTYNEGSFQPVPANIPKNVSTASSPSAEKTTAAASMSKNGSTASPPVTQPAAPLPEYIFRNTFQPVQANVPKNVSTASVSSNEKPSGQQSSTYNQPRTLDNHSSLRSEMNSAKKEEDKTKDYTEICLFHIWKKCKFGSRCSEMHFHLPYRWQKQNGSEWEDLKGIEVIEKAYCDPSISGTLSVDFLSMRSGSSRVRRLSTPSSASKPADFVLTTEWLWYWKDEYGRWFEYGKSNTKQASASITSSDLESIYLSDPTEKVYFRAGQQDYEIDFRTMTQRNIVYKTEKEMRRRPKFLSYNDVVKLEGTTKSAATGPSPHTGNTKTSIYPSTWDSTALPEVGYKLVTVPLTSTEGSDIKLMFMKTVKGHVVNKISRIQNPSLWQVFQLKKEQMKKENKGVNVREQRLFHGTSSAHLTAICHHNFDWRICGVHGTVYGQGSYFARDASYSHNYSPADLSGKRTMFLASVLVGESVKGDPSLRRPPSKHGSLTRFYDSCVDDVLLPSIFVVFEKHQIYPEYLIEYEEEKKSCCIS